MDDAAYLAMTRKIEALEARVEELEKRQKKPSSGGVIDRLLKKHPTMMNKTEASEILGVTRTTIYAMLRDGRLRATRTGKVSTQSVIDLISNPDTNTGRKHLDLRC